MFVVFLPASCRMSSTFVCFVAAVSLMVTGHWRVVDGLQLRQQQQQQLRNAITAEHKTREKRSSRWTKWFNVDRPDMGPGDFETVDIIQSTRRICTTGLEVVASQCRVAGTNITFDSTTAAGQPDYLLQPCSTVGIVCLNGQQHSGKCQDYEVRFFCQDAGSTPSPDSMFPNFDFKIYLVLIAVPLLVVTLRIIWSCCCKRRQKRRQQQLRQSSSVASSLSSSSSVVSMADSALANPPPAYADLFGSPRASVSAISSRFCQARAKCVHCEQAAIFNGDTRGQVMGQDIGQTVSELLQRQSGQEEQTVSGLGPVQTLDSMESGLNQSFAAQTMQSSIVLTTETVDDKDDVSEAVSDAQTVPTSSETEMPHSGSETCEAQNTHETSQNTEETSHSTRGASQNSQGNQTSQTVLQTPGLRSVASHASLHGAVAMTPTSTMPSLPHAPCACPCHSGFQGLIYGVNNLAFHWDSSEMVSSPKTPPHPGMHRPVFFFSRNSSVTSFSEPPDYEEALEILKRKEAELHVTDE